MIAFQNSELLAPYNKDIFQQLQQMLHNPGFHTSPQNIAFLKFVVKEIPENGNMG
jgi:hypothetical protein